MDFPEHREVPPRKVPPADWPPELQMLSYQKWLDQQGGTQAADPGESDPEEYLGGICPECEGINLPVKPYREHFDPPLKVTDPETVPADDLPLVIERYRERMVPAGDFLSVCDHLSDRELLRWIRDLLYREMEETPRSQTGVFELWEVCPGCFMEQLEESGPIQEDSLLEEIETNLCRTREQLEDLHDRRIEFYRERKIRWPPGAHRLSVLIESVLERLQEDVEEERNPLLNGNERAIIETIAGLKALRWLMAGVEELYREEPASRTLRLLQDSARMIRILIREQETQSGRFVDDLGTLLPDVEFLALLVSGWREDLEPPRFEDAPAGDWEGFFREDVTRKCPSFARLMEDSPRLETVKTAHEHWMRRQENLTIEEELYRRHTQNILGRAVQFDPEEPEAFLDGEVEPVRPEEVEPELFDNSELFVLMAADESRLTPDFLDRLDDLPEDSPADKDEPVRADPIEERLDRFLNRVRRVWKNTDPDHADACHINAVYQLTKAMEDVVSEANFHQETLDLRQPVEGGRRLVESALASIGQILSFGSTRLEELKPEVDRIIRRLDNRGP